MATVKALKPEEVIKARKESMPDKVIEVFNEMITEKFNGSSAIVHQDAVIKRLKQAGIDTSDIFNKGWLDVEDIYREQGWKVYYDKPGYNESYSAHFKFSKK